MKIWGLSYSDVMGRILKRKDGPGSSRDGSTSRQLLKFPKVSACFYWMFCNGRRQLHNVWTLTYMSPFFRTNGCSQPASRSPSPAEGWDLWPRPVLIWGQLQPMHVILFIRRKLNREQHWGMTGMCFHWRELQKRAARGRMRINVGAKLSPKGLHTWAEAED